MCYRQIGQDVIGAACMVCRVLDIAGKYYIQHLVHVSLQTDQEECTFVKLGRPALNLAQTLSDCCGNSRKERQLEILSFNTLCYRQIGLGGL